MADNRAVDTAITSVGLAMAGALVVLAAVLALWLRLNLGGNILWASLRALIQLLALGVVLTFLLAPGTELWWSFLWIVLMIPFAAGVVGRRAPEVPRARLLSLIAFSLTTFAVLGLIFGLGIFPLEARVLVPLAGMTIGNSMTATVLVATRIVAEFKQQRPLIEVSLALGYTASDAFRPYLRDALRTALVPQIETTKAVGIVFIPGAMTGLILAGVPVFDAVKVQVVVMYLVLASVAVSTTTIAVGLGRTLFTSDQRAIHLEGERG
ncbi:MAG: iron export ABC transporter permease subunit FetB [Actinobacteria bacterium]|nr:iron export ABC transporter permease subunit FetB [Actinomycetota bacterium]